MDSMAGELFDALLAHRQESESEWVFVQPQGRFTGKPYTENRGFPQALCEKAGVRPFCCHAIRHLTASILDGHDVPMVVIRRSCGTRSWPPRSAMSGEWPPCAPIWKPCAASPGTPGGCQRKSPEG